MAISALGYVVVGASDLSTWANYAQHVLGLECHEVEGALELRLDARAWRIRVEPDASDDLLAVGFETASPADFEQVLETLQAQGVTCTRDAALASARGVVEVATFTDPAGVRIELFYGATRCFEKPFMSPAGVQGFVTGMQGLGHIVIAVPDAATYQAFWSRIGFRLSDYIEFEPAPGIKAQVTFMHCNPRHHTLAFAQVPGAKRIVHLMVQTQQLDDVGLARDRAKRAGVPIAWDIGRHTNDHMTSFYMLSPSQWEFEYGWGAREIDDAQWTVERHDSISIWGHELTISPQERAHANT